MFELWEKYLLKLLDFYSFYDALYSVPCSTDISLDLGLNQSYSAPLQNLSAGSNYYLQTFNVKSKFIAVKLVYKIILYSTVPDILSTLI